jgi:LAGLIDADG-like domain
MNLSAWARGYFDAEGGVPRDLDARFYVQFVQKNRSDLAFLKSALESLGLQCGALHTPSVRVDPDYCRVYVSASSHLAFIETVRSWHPRKRRILNLRRAQLGAV